MQVLDCTKQVVNYVLCMLHLQVNVRFYDLFQITLRVLHNHIERVKSGWVLGIEQLDQLDDEWMLQFSHESDLTEDSLAVRLVFKDVLHPLNRHFLSRASPRSQRNFSIAASAKQSLTSVVIAHLPI